MDGKPQLSALTLSEGSIFHIPTGAMHSFHTGSECMDIIAFHPDSNYGPKPEDHPMINKTMFDGVSAAFSVPYEAQHVI